MYRYLFFSTVAVDLTAPGISLTIGKEDAQKKLRDQLQGLTDTDNSTCVSRRRSDDQYRQLNLAISFEQCLKLQSVTIVGKNLTASMSSPSDQIGWKVVARSLCPTENKTQRCAASNQKSGEFHYKCSTVSARQVTVEVPAGFSICQLNIYAFPGKTNNNLDCFLFDEYLVRS